VFSELGFEDEELVFEDEKESASGKRKRDESVESSGPARPAKKVRGDGAHPRTIMSLAYFVSVPRSWHSSPW
jgi:hypothetical protein